MPLAGSFTVAHHHFPGEWETRLHGRASVFDGPTDVLYLPSGDRGGDQRHGRVAVAEAPTTESQAVAVHPRVRDSRRAARGGRARAGRCTTSAPRRRWMPRELIVCEVITPAENWSSYPPHKHDEHVPGHESRLEEIYYFETAPARGRDRRIGGCRVRHVQHVLVAGG